MMRCLRSRLLCRTRENEQFWKHLFLFWDRESLRWPVQQKTIRLQCNKWHALVGGLFK